MAQNLSHSNIFLPVCCYLQYFGVVFFHVCCYLQYFGVVGLGSEALLAILAAAQPVAQNLKFPRFGGLGVEICWILDLGIRADLQNIAFFN